MPSCWPGSWNRTPPIRENVEVIINQTMRCQQIVNRLLDFSRQSLGEKKLFDVNEIIRRCVDLVRHQAFFHNIKINQELDPGCRRSSATRASSSRSSPTCSSTPRTPSAAPGHYHRQPPRLARQTAWSCSSTDTGCGIPAGDQGQDL